MQSHEKDILLSVIVLTWNSEAYAVQCLESVYAGTPFDDGEVIIVDNGSKDNTIEVLERHFNHSSLKIIKNQYNRGIAGGRNQGIAEANGKYIVFLDIDTVVQEGSLCGLIAYMENHPTVGICAPKLIFPDGVVQNSCRRFPLIHTKILRRIKGKRAADLMRSEYYPNEIGQSDPFDVDYVIGACQVVRRAALDEVGDVDETFFYGPDDVDLCLRMHMNKWRVVVVPTMTVVHHEQRVTKARVWSRLTIKHLLALVCYFKKHRYWISRERLYRRMGKTC